MEQARTSTRYFWLQPGMKQYRGLVQYTLAMRMAHLPAQFDCVRGSIGPEGFPPAPTPNHRTLRSYLDSQFVPVSRLYCVTNWSCPTSLLMGCEVHVSS